MKTYRVWMKDGYCGTYDAENAEDAKAQAIAATKRNIAGVAMTAREVREALTVESVEELN